MWKKCKNIALKIWDYFRPSWEGDDKKFSYKRFAQFVFLHLIIVLALRGVHGEYEFYTFLTLVIVFGLTSTLITVQQLIIMLKYYSRKKRDSFDFTNVESEDTESLDALKKLEEDAKNK